MSARIAALTSTSTKSNRKRKAEELSTIVPLKQLHFYGQYIRQHWPFRDSLINYITKNPKTSKVWQKLIQSCKYFFAKNPIFVIERLYFNWENKWMASLNSVQKIIDFTKISSKLWITDNIDTFYTSPKNLSSIIPEIYKCDVKYLHLRDYVISYEDFSFLSSNVRRIVLRENIVKNSDGSIVPLEKIFAALPKIKSIVFYDKIDSSCITKNTVKELLKIPHFSKINKLYFFHIPETFDTETFFKCSKKNKNAEYFLRFCDTLSEAYKNRLEAIVDEIIETETHDYKVPDLEFDGLSEEKWDKLVFILSSQD